MVLLTLILLANASMSILTLASPRMFEKHFTVMQSVHFGLDIMLMAAVLILYATLVKIARLRQSKETPVRAPRAYCRRFSCRAQVPRAYCHIIASWDQSSRACCHRVLCWAQVSRACCHMTPS